MSENVLDGSVASVEAHVAEHPEDAKALLEAEKAKDEPRKTLVASLEKVVEGQHEAPEAVEPKAVTVEPAAAPTTGGLLSGFEVTPERGYRRPRADQEANLDNGIREMNDDSQPSEDKNVPHEGDKPKG